MTGEGKLSVTAASFSGVSQSDRATVFNYSAIPSLLRTLSVTVQRTDDGTGEVGCTIKIDGAVVSSNTSTGRFAVAKCNP